MRRRMRLCVAEMRSTYAFAVSANRKCSAYWMCRASSFSLAGARTASSEARRWLSDRPRHPFGPPLISLYRFQRWQGAAALSAAVTINHAYRRRAHAAWAHKPEGRVKPIPSYSSGEGVWGRGASLREAASPPAFPHPRLFGREREGGDFSAEKSPPSHPITLNT